MLQRCLHYTGSIVQLKTSPFHLQPTTGHSQSCPSIFVVFHVGVSQSTVYTSWLYGILARRIYLYFVAGWNASGIAGSGLQISLLIRVTQVTHTWIAESASFGMNHVDNCESTVYLTTWEQEGFHLDVLYTLINTWTDEGCHICFCVRVSIWHNIKSRTRARHTLKTCTFT